MSDEFENMTVAQLKDVLRERDLPVSGKKAELIARLQESSGDAEADSPEVSDTTEEFEEDFEDEDDWMKKQPML